MATVNAYSSFGYGFPNVANLSNAQAGNGATTNVVDRGANVLSAALIRITTAVGATPTCTYVVEGSADNVNWVPAAIADPATPETMSVATFTITTAGVTLKIVRPNHPWRYLRMTYSANTNVTNTADIFVY